MHQRRTLAVLLVLVALLMATPVAAQVYGVIPQMGPWDGGPNRIAYCPGPANLHAEPEADFLLLSCPTWTPTAPPSPLSTPTPTATATPTVTMVPTETPTDPPPPPETYTPNWTPTATPTATATITATETVTMAEITYTDGYGGDVYTAVDTYVRSGASAASNFGISAAVAIDSDRRTLLYFDLSAIPATATCVSATLTLYQTSSGAARALTLTAWAIASGNAGWVEGTKNNATAGSGEPSWAAKAADGSGGVTTAWAGSAGLSTSGTDYESPALGSVAGDRSDANGTAYNISLNTTRVAGWFGASNTNYGILVSHSVDGGSYGLSDHATTGYRPKLVVVYEEAGGGLAYRAPLRVWTSRR